MKKKIKGTQEKTFVRPSSHKLKLTAPIDRWDEAIPLGNGLLGVLCWGGERKIKLSLDRGDLWDLRVSPAVHRSDWSWRTIQNCIAKNDQVTISKLFDEPYLEPFPTKIPAGRIELDLTKNQRVESFRLDLDKALATVNLTQGRLDAFCCAVSPVILVRSSDPNLAFRIISPAFGQRTSNGKAPSVDMGHVGRLGYPSAQAGRFGTGCYVLQHGADGLIYVVALDRQAHASGWEIAITITSTKDGADPLGIARERIAEALTQGFDRLFARHHAWWKAFWSKSSVSLPNPAIENHYYLGRYFYGSASRRGFPPIPLQGVWTADEGTLPPWKGDYHNDLNTQLTYWPYLAANHLEEGLCFLDFLWDLLPKFKTFAQRFFGTKGAAVPGVMALDGQAMGGWCQYSLSPTAGAWLAHGFYLHWRYTMDREFLKQRAYPFCTQIAQCLQGLLKPDGKGKLKFSLSSSPEIHDNDLQAYLTPNSNYDLALLRWLFGALAEMAGDAHDPAGAREWKGLLRQLPELAVDSDRGLMLSPDETLTESHRHHSHLLAIHPLGLMNIEGSERDRQAIRHSLFHIDRLGFGLWCGYSFSWMACLAARAGQTRRALNMLELYLSGFVSRNGFHLNGDFKNIGLSTWKYRPFTLEGNFAALQAVHEMLLQSWGGVIRIFPAVADEWREVEFTNLRTEGAFRVSARRKAGHTVWVRIEAEKDNVLHLNNPFQKMSVRWNRKDLTKMKKPFYRYRLKTGEFLEGTVE